MNKLSLSLLLACSAWAQATTTDTTLPSMTVGIGPSWTRGDIHAASADVDVALRLGSSNVFSWSTVSTPVATVPKGAQPLASTITTGFAYVAARSTSGSVSLLTIVQAGFNSVQATGTTSPAFTGSAGLAIRMGRTNLYVMPYMKASNPQRGTDGALVSATLQPGFMLIYGFGGK